MTTETFTPAAPMWCAGCGDFAVRSSLQRALTRLGIADHDTVILAGIGCSGTIQNTIHAYGYHALHGRVLPTATGVALANPDLTVIAAGGDGDGYAIGAGHLVHTFRRNPPLTYVLMNNGTYGLTKGQSSPTTSALADGDPRAFDAMLTGLSIPTTTFLARAYSGWIEQLDQLLEAALVHAAEKRGFAFLEVISPCVTYRDIYPMIERRLENLDSEPGHDVSDRADAFARCLDAHERAALCVGLVYRDPSALPMPGASPAEADVDPERLSTTYAQMMETHVA